ncbi:MAG TPA: 50S ribosomal protein L3 N(5)-glutamine methyltransferase [Pseudomonadales bacterium]|nr:50S ribosomal protein L3 N(5)-glutamine methyltransferase [Pseudomonadales bacterium]
MTQQMTLQDWLAEAGAALQDSQVFLGHGTDNMWDESLQLTLPLLAIPFDAPRDILQRVITDEELLQLRAALQQRVEKRIPVAYITQQSWFCGMPFYVDERVLIPRSPIGELIENGFAPWLLRQPARILDLCCGSACIAIACAEFFPDAEIDAADISADALAVAAINVEHYQSAVSLVQSDMFSGLQGRRYDLIVCNPPYVDADDMDTLPDEYRHEPALALASGTDGLDFTRQLLREAADHLTDDGVLIVEVGNSAPALEEAFPFAPFVWLEFERGGDGVFLLTADALRQHF